MNGRLDSQPRWIGVSATTMKRGMILAVALLGATTAAAAPVKIERNSKLLQFTYAWPAEAAAVPALDRRFRSDMDKSLREFLANAREDQALAKQQKRPFNQHYYAMQWTTAGQTPRLLSLQNQLGTFEGGAHPMTTYNALLWNRRAHTPVSIAALFVRPGDLAAVTRAAYCKALDAERAKRREGMKIDLAEFNQCPKYSDLAIAPVDKDKDGKFDALRFVASPYVAGPYVEGDYAIILPLTPKLISDLKPDYRASFEL
jgi:hypothetical protein